uniref:Glycosyltransferase RgtA/B/C/D-like domain-containing protein n=1 Tax=uncultured marine thaumarchaeote KM3_74_H09 TaxID=1456276 RepID=A0A075HS78_9ARCH|nr:hypothetical protein [uncultured marine thaumarchaeote KM3_74_H09]
MQIKSNKYPIIVTVSFFTILLYVAFVHHNYWFEYDGIYFLGVGKEVIAGNGSNVISPDAPIGGPILHAVLSSVFGDAFAIGKLISLFSGTGIVFFSYYIIKNIFNSRVALLGQLFIAFNPILQLSSIQALNDLLPVFLIVSSLYFITKKNLKPSDIIISGALLGAAFMVRYQALVVIIAIIIFLLIRNRKIRINLSYGIIISVIFLIVCSPLLVYNYTTHGVLLDNDVDFYLLQLSKYQTDEWHKRVTESVVGNRANAIFLDFDLFLKNYFYNLSYHNPSRLFNFDTLDNLSIFPAISFLGTIPVFGGLIYCLKIKLNRNNIIATVTTAVSTISVIFLVGDITVHFFMIIIIPLLTLGILNIRNIEKNLLPLLVLPVVYFLIISIAPMYSADLLLPVLITAIILSAIFFVNVAPRLLSHLGSAHSAKIITIVLVSVVLLTNIGFSYKLFEYNLYDPLPDSEGLMSGAGAHKGVVGELYSLFQETEPKPQAGKDLKEVGDILSKQPGIENSYVMTRALSYAYYADSKHIYTDFMAGMKNDTINQFVTRENWSPYDIYYSNISSYPVDKNNLYKSTADYLIYQPPPAHFGNTTWYVKPVTYPDLQILLDPENPDIPSNFELLYKSDATQTVVYKIHH